MDSFWNGPLGNESEEIKAYSEEIAQREASRLVRKLMKERSISQVKLAELLGKDPAEISRYLKGTRNMTLKSLAQCLAVMGCRLMLSAEKATLPLGGPVLRVHDGEQWRGDGQPEFRVEGAQAEAGDCSQEAA